jgi:hypothetical protein
MGDGYTLSIVFVVVAAAMFQSHFLRSTLLVLVLLLPGFTAAAPSAIAPQDLMLVIRAGSDADTAAAAQRIQAAAEAGNSYAMYNVGSLHRQSSRKGAAVFAYDPGKSLKWLTRAFAAGRLTAAYKAALVYAQIGDDMEAMGWAQLYSEFVRPSERTVGQQQLRLALQDELYGRVGRDRPDAIEARKMTLMDRHGRDHKANQDRVDAQHPDWAPRGTRCTAPASADDLAKRLKLPGHSLIEYLIKVSANGRPESFAVLDAAPHAVAEADLAALIQDLNCEDAEPGQYLFHFVQVRSPDSRERTED